MSTTPTINALARAEELSEAVREAEYEIQEIGFEEEIARVAPARLERELEAYFNAVFAAARDEDPGEQHRLEEELRAARDRLSSNPRTGERFVIDLRSKKAAADRDKLTPAKRELYDFVSSHRVEIATELLEHAHAAREQVKEALRGLQAAIGHHDQVANAWTPFVNMWHGGDWTWDKPASPNALFATLNLEIPLPAPKTIAGTLVHGDLKMARRSSVTYGIPATPPESEKDPFLQELARQRGLHR